MFSQLLLMIMMVCVYNLVELNIKSDKIKLVLILTMLITLVTIRYTYL